MGDKTVENIPLRAALLQNALNLTVGNRDEEYGDPYENLDNVACLWTAYLEAKYCTKLPSSQNLESTFRLTAEDAAWFNVLQKIARTFSGRVKLDTYTDSAAYAAIAGECAVKEKTE
jgi:hypothetical protein